MEDGLSTGDNENDAGDVENDAGDIEEQQDNEPGDQQATGAVVPKTFNFKEILPASATNIRVTPDSLIYAVDLIGATTGQDVHGSNKALVRLLKNNLYDKKSFIERELPGSYLVYSFWALILIKAHFGPSF